MLLLLSLLFLSLSRAEVFFKENFDDPSSLDQWVISNHRKDEQGSLNITAGVNGLSEDMGMMTMDDAKFYFLSRDITPFSNRDKTVVIQYSVRWDKHRTCGGSYIKLLGSNFDKSEFKPETDYHIMFGPDLCSPTTKKVHVIFNYKGTNHLIKKEIRTPEDKLTHHFALIITPDNKYKVRVDCEDKEEGALDEDFDFLQPKKINDPSQSKPTDWVDEAIIDDPEDVKPDGWDVPEKIKDPEAKKPDDWDDEDDGEWEAPLITNPDFQGEWKPKKIDHPDYKGQWIHPKIDNPEYEYDPSIYAFDDIARIGIELWQVEASTIFDNFLITDDPAYAETLAKKVCEKQKDEKAIQDKKEEEARAAAESSAPKDDDSDDADEEEMEFDDTDEKSDDQSTAEKDEL